MEERPDESEPPSVSVLPLVDTRIQRLAMAVVALFATIAAAWVASALWAGLLLGLLTAFAVEPLHRRLTIALKGRRTLAAVILLTLVVLVMAAILGTVVASLVGELVSGVQALRETLQRFVDEGALPEGVTRTLAALGITQAMVAQRIVALSERATELATSVVSTILGSTFSWLGGAFIACLTAYNVLKDGKPIERRIEQFLPLHPRTTRELVDEFRKVGRGTLIGSVLAAIAQGFLATIGYSIGGLQRALLLGVVTAIASFIPVIGTLLAWVPVVVVLFVTGHPVGGIFVLVWNLVVTVALVDYGLRPLLAGAESRSHPLLFLIGLIGGVEIFGPFGLIAGPIVMAVFASAMRIYRREVLDPAREESA